VENTIHALQKSILRLVYIAENQERLTGDAHLGCNISLEINGDKNSEEEQPKKLEL
jgi:hypothetical protein